MQPREFALVSFRVIAVYVGVQSVWLLATISTLFEIQPPLPIAVIISVLTNLIPSAVAILLWVLAPKLSVLAIGESAPTEQESSLSIRDFTHSGLTILGAYIFVTAFPTFLAQLLSQADEARAVPIRLVAASALQCVLAILLIVGAKRLTQFALRLRQAGLSQ